MQVAEIIKALGGATAVGKALGLGATAVSNWTMRDAIATEHHLALWRLATSKNIAWAPPGAEGLMLVRDTARQRSECELLDAFQATDDQGREMILRLVRSLRSEAPARREAAE